MNKKLLILMLSLILVFSLSACSGDKEETTGDSDKKVVATTTTFLADIVEHLVGDKVEIKLIIPAGEDPHTYEAKPDDMKALSSADMVLYHGLHFEGKMIEALEQLGQEATREFKDEELGQMTQDGEIIIDPHFWFDLELYEKAVRAVSEDLTNLLPDEKESIAKNTEEYIAELKELDEYISQKIGEIPKERRYLITPHDAFNYFSRAYDIEVQAPQGVSTDSEVAISDMSKTVDFIVEHNVKAIFAETTTDPARMEKLREEVKSRGFDVKVVRGEGHELYSDSLAPKGHEGDNFIDMYKHNVDLMNENLK